MIEVKGLYKSYNNKNIFENISITLLDGNIYALVGVNGIGKSTFLNCINQSSFMDSGYISIDSISNTILESKFNIFYIPDDKDLFLNLTGIEYLSFIIKIYNVDFNSASAKINNLSFKLKMQNTLSDYISSYSLGMKQKIYLMGALISNASNLILDEPFNGLDPESSIVVKELLYNYCIDNNNLILYSIHNLDLVSNFSNEIIFIDNNRKFLTVENTGNILLLEEIFRKHCII